MTVMADRDPNHQNQQIRKGNSNRHRRLPRLGHDEIKRPVTNKSHFPKSNLNLGARAYFPPWGLGSRRPRSHFPFIFIVLTCGPARTSVCTGSRFPRPPSAIFLTFIIIYDARQQPFLRGFIAPEPEPVARGPRWAKGTLLWQLHLFGVSRTNTNTHTHAKGSQAANGGAEIEMNEIIRFHKYWKRNGTACDNGPIRAGFDRSEISAKDAGRGNHCSDKPAV